MSCYGRILSSYPLAVVAAVATISIACLVAVFTTHSIPDFSDPQLGFECRGTVLARRATAWENLLRATRSSGPFNTNPLEAGTLAAVSQTTTSPQTKASTTKSASTGGNDSRSSWGAVRTRGNRVEDDHDEEDDKILKKGGKDGGNKWQSLHPFEVLRGRESAKANHSHFQWGETVTRSPAHLLRHKPKWNQLQQLGTSDHFRPDENKEHPKHSSSFFFCDQPHIEYAHVVFAPIAANDSLWSVEALHSMCRLDETLRSSDVFPSVCQTVDNNSHQCCPSWSLGQYVTLMTNRSECSEIDERDLKEALNVLTSCAKHYYGLQLSANCDAIVQEGTSGNGDGCSTDIPEACTRYNAVYHILHYLVDAGFLVNGHLQLRNAALFLPVARSTALLPYYYLISHLVLSDNLTQIVAMDMGLKETLFNEYMIRDVLYLSIGAAIVFLLMWWYTASLFLTFMAVTSIALSLAVAYFIYTFVFELEFFPFMNLLAAVIVVGIGADDVFVYVQVWRCTKLDKDSSTLAKLVTDTLSHAGLSMLVTSLTTAAAFFSTFVCPVTAIRCFSLFAGLAVTVHFLFMLSWLPASVLLAEKYCSPICRPGFLPPNPLRRCLQNFSDVARITFDKILPCIVVKMRYFWIALFGTFAICAAVIVFYYPKLELPDSKEFQLFSSDHLFERYDLEFKSEFWFEKSQRMELVSKLPLRFVWGILAEDNGNYLDPNTKGTLVLDSSFNVATPESQEWLSHFCRNIRDQPFFQPTLGPLLPNCFIETFQSWMNRRCEDSIDRKDRTPCCETSSFPYTEDVFNQCILLAVKDLYETPSEFFLPGMAGPRFSKTTHKIQALVVEYDSNISYSLSYAEMHQFYRQVEDWMQSQLANAPSSMKNGWFTSDLAFYDVQHSLSEGTVSAIALAMAIALLVLMCATGNLWLSVISVVSLSSVVLVSVAVLVLLGWKLNILESVSVTIAVGLSVDFTLHYAVGYKLSGQDADRESAVVYTLSRMSSPIAMAAVTTLCAGAAVLPSSLVAYQQIGTFVVVVMVTSWLYSTLFLTSLLRLCGPQHGCTQMRCPPCVSSCCSCCCQTTPSSPTHHIDKTVYSYGLSESTLSTSSTSCPNPNAQHGETHELEPLTTGSHRIKGVRRPRSSSMAAAVNGTDSINPSAQNSSAIINQNLVKTEETSRKVSLPSTALLASSADDREPEVVCIETQNSDM